MARKIPSLLLAAGLAFAAAPVKNPPAKVSATVRRWMKTMTLRQEVAQLVFIEFHGGSPNTRSRDYQKFVRLIRDTNIGGLVLTNAVTARGVQKAEPYALAAFLNRMQRLARVPLLVSADFERGASMRMSGTTPFPPAMAFGATGDPELTRFEGAVTAREARALGVQWVFAPVADVNNNPDNPIINIRSFGENPQDVAAHVKAFIEGAHSDKRNYVLTTAKHFPGHGDTAVDTHLSLAAVTADRARIESLELVPFRAAIAAGTDSVMTGHLAVPALAPQDLPATLSPAILTGLLRNELGFKGLVITDALGMGAIVNGFGAGDAAVRALEAGADTLLMPADADVAIHAVLAAVQSGRLTRQRIQASVAKLLSAKERLGLDRRRAVDVESIGDVIDDPAVNEKAQEIADRAVTLVRNSGGMLPLAAPEHVCFVTMAESRFSTDGVAFAQEVRKRAPKAALIALDGTMTRDQVDDSVARLTECAQYAIAAFAPVNAGAGAVGMSSELSRAIEGMIATGKPVALAALGNPYLLRAYPKVAAYLATFSTVVPSEIAAVKALWGEVAIRGHLPVTIPGEARYGEGIQLAATRGTTKGANQK
ncbi:MAG TPA: glycoside hydrolase family 3 protein [Bryobacteraceae bacterium]|jgi:beta-N-acetylhexosaminidase|nr:glycoside hydrolase family 3 protein [Bryobacteraceae bacterium]